MTMNILHATPKIAVPFHEHIKWYTLDGFPHIAYHICAVDEAARIVDILFKFDANSQIVLHRHKADYITLTLSGELRIYNANGELKEIRPTGAYVVGKADGEPHREGGGDEDVIAFFSNRNVGDVIYEILDDNLNPVGMLGMEEFKALHAAQSA